MIRSDINKIIQPAYKFVTLSLMLLPIGGCGTVSYVSKLWNVSVQTEEVTLTAAPNVNRDFPVAVDLVAVEDKAFAQVLADTPANKWFESRSTFLSNNPDKIDVRSYELVPGQTIEGIDYSWGDRRSYGAIYVYAGYLTPGTHRIRVDSYDTPVVVLGPKTLDVGAGDD